MTTVPGDAVTARQRRPSSGDPTGGGLTIPTSTPAGSRSCPTTRCWTRRRRRSGSGPCRSTRCEGCASTESRSCCVAPACTTTTARSAPPTIDRAEERRVELLKAAGFNAIRSAHNPMSRPMLAACDRLGMLVMDETFDMWTEPEERVRLRAAIPRVVGGRRRGHGPQGLQPPQRDPVQHRQRDPRGRATHGARVGRALAEKIRSLDATRLVTQAISGLLVGGSELFAELRRRDRQGMRDGGGRRGDGREHGHDQAGRTAEHS